MLKRSILYLRRKNRRSILLLILLFVISFSLAVGLSVCSSINAVTKEVQDRLGTSFVFRIPTVITNDPAYYQDVTDINGKTQKYYIGPELNNDTIRQVMEHIDGITGFNAELDMNVYVEDANLYPGMFQLGARSTDPAANERFDMREHVTMIYGNTTTEQYGQFRSGSFELVEGRHITASDQFKALVSDEFAKLNALTVGDHITLSQRAGLAGYPNPNEIWGMPHGIEIIGIYHVNGYQPTTRWTAETDITYNWLLTDIETVEYFKRIGDVYVYDGREHELRYRNVTFFVDDPSQLDAIMDSVRDIKSFDSSLYTISADDTMYKSTVEPLNSIRNIVAVIVGIIVVGCTIVLCVVFTMWVRSRRKEIAIYLSLGFRKIEIIGQFVLEATIVALVALALTFVTCQQVPDLIGNRMLASTIEAAQPQEKEYTWEEIGQAAMSGTTDELFSYESSTYAGPEHIDFTFGLAEVLILVALELLIIVAAICKGSSFIFKLQPRQILTTLS